MGVRPIDMVMMPQMPEVSNQKQREQTARPIAEQANAQVLVQKEVDVKTHQVTSKDNADNKHQKKDAKDEADNKYQGQDKKTGLADGKVTTKSKNGSSHDYGYGGGFDISI